jgi:ribonuclease HII
MTLSYDLGLVAGVDEVGRGPLVGNVVTAAVILDPVKPIDGLKDSKKCTDKQLQALNEDIQAKAVCFAYGYATPAEIDDLNILHATMLAMSRAVSGLSVTPTHVLVDGNRIPTQLTIAATACVKGDGIHACIAAASILAKVARDAEMLELDRRHPEYGFARHKGYPTLEHRRALIDHGVLTEHRKSFGPVQRCL